MSHIAILTSVRIAIHGQNIPNQATWTRQNGNVYGESTRLGDRQRKLRSSRQLITMPNVRWWIVYIGLLRIDATQIQKVILSSRAYLRVVVISILIKTRYTVEIMSFKYKTYIWDRRTHWTCLLCRRASWLHGMYRVKHIIFLIMQLVLVLLFSIVSLV